MTRACLFSTEIGVCAVAWGDGGVVGVDLPGHDEARLRARLRRLHPDADETTPSGEIADLIEALRSMLAGEPVDLSDVRLDMAAVPDFDRAVLTFTRTIPYGATRTYGEVAAAVGAPAAAQAVGRALGRNPFPLVVPCHRVVAAGGRPGGFSAPGGVHTKRRLLEIERAAGFDAPALFPLT